MRKTQSTTPTTRVGVVDTVRELLRNKRDFIIDECNITKSNRIDIIRFIRNNSVGDF